MRTLFDSTVIGPISLKNRLIRSATWEGMAEPDGTLPARLFSVYEELAAGGIGMIITGAAVVMQDALPVPGMMQMNTDACIPEYQKLTGLVHQYNVPIILQCTWVGRNGEFWNPGDLSRDDIHAVSEAFGDAAYRAKMAGFDGFQIHSAHGYLISQFLNSRKNTRTDEYGGTAENRTRFLLGIYDAVRSRTGPSFPVFVKINCGDFGGSPDDVFDSCLCGCTRLAEKGISGIEISGGVQTVPKQPEVQYSESIFRDQAAQIAARVPVPVIMVGVNRNPVVMTEILNNSDIGYFSLSRPLLRDPALPRFWQDHPDEPSECTSCDSCRNPGGISCPFR
jgi:2,4-dienoyl-CoA reductase-like NADH-dependent reductase (Old Yellow Enzyme family)